MKNYFTIRLFTATTVAIFALAAGGCGTREIPFGQDAWLAYEDGFISEERYPMARWMVGNDYLSGKSGSEVIELLIGENPRERMAADSIVRHVGRLAFLIKEKNPNLLIGIDPCIPVCWLVVAFDGGGKVCGARIVDSRDKAASPLELDEISECYF